VDFVIHIAGFHAGLLTRNVIPEGNFTSYLPFIETKIRVTQHSKTFHISANREAQLDSVHLVRGP
jgi:hypothetical protein